MAAIAAGVAAVPAQAVPVVVQYYPGYGQTQQTVQPASVQSATVKGATERGATVSPPGWGDASGGGSWGSPDSSYSSYGYFPDYGAGYGVIERSSYPYPENSINHSVLINPTVINSPIYNSTLVNPKIVSSPSERPWARTTIIRFPVPSDATGVILPIWQYPGNIIRLR
jgi:hypothetical protein